ncbi:hypothetical protein MRX96_052831 [Rhipicephalus microplus]
MKPATEKSFIGLGTFDLLNECSRAKQNSTFDQNAPAVRVCDAQAKHGSFGLAAYDVNYDQGDNVCPKWGAKGHYSRLYLVQKAQRFYERQEPGWRNRL